MNKASRLGAAIAAALVVPLGFAGCASPESVVEAVEPAVLAVDPAIRDVYFSTASGPAGTSLAVRLYVDPVDTPELARIIDGSLLAIQTASPERLASFKIDVAEGEKPDKVNLNVGDIDIEDAARELGLYDHYSGNSIRGAADVLDDRYGTWKELHK